MKPNEAATLVRIISSSNTTYDEFLRKYVVLRCNYVRIMSSKIGSKTSVFHDYFLSRKTVIKDPARKNRFDLGLGTLYKELGFIRNKTSFGNRILFYDIARIDIAFSKNLLFFQALTNFAEVLEKCSISSTKCLYHNSCLFKTLHCKLPELVRILLPWKMTL